MLVRFEVAPRSRCDLLFYTAPNLTGKRASVRIFPSGVQGLVHTEDVRSMVVRAPHGTRVILVTRPGSAWQDSTWRCIRMVRGNTVPSSKSAGLPGVRIPDLDLLDEPHLKKTNPVFESTYPMVERLGQSTEWTYGKVDEPQLKGNVRLIIVERDDTPHSLSLSAAERLARVVLSRARAIAPEAVPELAASAASVLHEDEAQALQEWLDTLE